MQAGTPLHNWIRFRIWFQIPRRQIHAMESYVATEARALRLETAQFAHAPATGLSPQAVLPVPVTGILQPAAPPASRAGAERTATPRTYATA